MRAVQAFAGMKIFPFPRDGSHFMRTRYLSCLMTNDLSAKSFSASTSMIRRTGSQFCGEKSVPKGRADCVEESTNKVETEAYAFEENEY